MSGIYWSNWVWDGEGGTKNLVQNTLKNIKLLNTIQKIKGGN